MTVVVVQRELQRISKPTENEITGFFYSQLSKTLGRPVILSLIPGYSDAYVPASQLSDYPKPLTDLFDPSAETLTFDDLTIKCKEIYDNLVVTADQATLVEKMTRGQAKSRLWFQQRAGRITASKIKNALSTSVGNPAPSLIKIFATQNPQNSTLWLVNMGASMKERVHVYNEKEHTSFEVIECSLVVDPMFPSLGASTNQGFKATVDIFVKHKSHSIWTVATTQGWLLVKVRRLTK